MKPKEKNLLDLQHSLSLNKGTLFLSIGIGGALSVFFGGKQIGITIINSFIIAFLFSLPFVYNSIKNFLNCKKIQDTIRKSI